MALPAENRRYTFADVLTWDESERVEIINGEAFMMAPPSRIHQEILTSLFGQLYDYLKGKKCKVYPAPFGVRLFEEDGDYPEDVDTMVEPDISVVCDPGKLDDHGCKGAPDLIIEILSRSTRQYDRITKFHPDLGATKSATYTLKGATSTYNKLQQAPTGEAGKQLGHKGKRR